jgi:23S rRNA C2498 (ribose-2'-O)-methylase RlmM
MGKEALYVPEEYLKHVIEVLRTGLEVEKVPTDVSKELRKWCKDEEEYLRRSFRKEHWPRSRRTK